MDIPLTVKLRMGVLNKKPVAHKLIPFIKEWGVSQITVGFVLGRLVAYDLVLTPLTAPRPLARAALLQARRLGLHRAVRQACRPHSILG